MSSLTRSPQDWDDALRRQVRLLLASAATYDAGGPHMDDEALNMATRLRVLLHTGQHPSSLERLGLLPGMRMCDSVGPPPKDGVVFFAAMNHVVNLRPTGHERHVSFVPALNSQLKMLPPGQQAARLASWPDFPTWWQAVLVRDHDKRSFTRKELVLAVANKDGGTHLDPQLPEAYSVLTRGPGTIGISIRMDDDATEHDGGDPTPALIRQITYEVERSLRKAAPGLMP